MTEGSTRAEEMVGRGIRQSPVAIEVSTDPSETDLRLESVRGAYGVAWSSWMFGGLMTGARGVYVYMCLCMYVCIM